MEEENGKLAESETPNPPETAPVLPPRLPDAPEVPISRWKKWGADSVKAVLALLMLALGVAVWWQPPLVAAKSPSVSYTFQGKVFRDAELYAPLSVPTRYYIRLPHELARRYSWFAVDRRREVAALSKEPGWSGASGSTPILWSFPTPYFACGWKNSAARFVPHASLVISKGAMSRFPKGALQQLMGKVCAFKLGHVVAKFRIGGFRDLHGRDHLQSVAGTVPSLFYSYSKSAIAFFK